MILPAALEYQSKLASSIIQTKICDSRHRYGTSEKLLRNLTEHINQLKTNLEHLDAIAMKLMITTQTFSLTLALSRESHSFHEYRPHFCRRIGKPG